MATFYDHQDPLWDPKRPLDLPEVEFPTRITREEYEERWQNQRTNHSATEEGFPENQISEPAASGVHINGTKRT